MYEFPSCANNQNPLPKDMGVARIFFGGNTFSKNSQKKFKKFSRKIQKIFKNIQKFSKNFQKILKNMQKNFFLNFQKKFQSNFRKL